MHELATFKKYNAVSGDQIMNNTAGFVALWLLNERVRSRMEAAVLFLGGTSRNDAGCAELQIEHFYAIPLRKIRCGRSAGRCTH